MVAVQALSAGMGHPVMVALAARVYQIPTRGPQSQDQVVVEAPVKEPPAAQVVLAGEELAAITPGRLGP